MIFDVEYDNSLYIILSSDIKNRENIAKIIYNMPKEVLEKIRKCLDENKYINEYKCAKRDESNNIYIYVINIIDNEIRIVYNKWSNNLEEMYKLSLCRFKDNINMDYPCYLGNYDEIKSYVIWRTVFVRENVRDYEIEKDIFLGKLVSLSDDPDKYWIVNLKNKDMKIERDDLKNMDSVNKLLRRRKK